MSISGTVLRIDPLRGCTEVPRYRDLTSEQLEDYLKGLVHQFVGDCWAEAMLLDGIEEFRLRRLARSAG